MPAFAPRPYEPRPTRFAGVEERDGWRLKRYVITGPGVTLDEVVQARGREAAGAALPTPAQSPGRAGVGFVIDHQALDAVGVALHYVVLCWWDRENELFSRTFVSSAEAGWEWMEGEGAPCVWDLRVVWHERNAYVRHVLGAQADVEAYLNDTGPIPE